MSDSNKPVSAFLTQTQREYVTGRSNPSNESQMKSRIVDRVHAGLNQDGKILPNIDPETRREIFREWRNKNYELIRGDEELELRKPDAMPDRFEKSQFGLGLEGLLRFLYLGIEESNVGDFWEILEEAIDQAARERGQHVSHFEYDVQFSDLATIEDTYKMLESGELEFDDLTLSELQALLESDLMSLEDLSDESLEQYIDAIGALDEVKSGLTELKNKREDQSRR